MNPDSYPCFCNRLYRLSIPTTILEYAFSGSLCRIREFQTMDGLRCCLTIFSLSDYKHLHFPYNEYKWLISKLYALLSTQAILPTASKTDTLSIKHLTFDGDFKIVFGNSRLNIGSVTAFGIVKTSPFTDVDDCSVNKNHFTCDFKWDICTCKTCPVFKSLIEYEATALQRFSEHKMENVIFFNNEKK